MRKLKPNLSSIYSSALKASRFILIFLVVFFLVMFFLTRQRIDTHTRQFQADLLAFYEDEIRIKVQLDETIPVELSIPIAELVDLTQVVPAEIPFSTTVPVQTTVRINQTVRLPVDLPFLGRTIVDLPLDLDIPIDEEIPVSTTIKFDPAAIQDPGGAVHIDQEIPIKFPLELEISIEDLGLEPGFVGLEALIDTLRFVFLLEKIDWARQAFHSDNE